MLAAGNTTGFVRNIRLFVTARVLNFILSDIVSLIWTSTVQSGYTDVDSGLSHVLAGLMLRVMERYISMKLLGVLTVKVFVGKKC